jgi:DNA-3-methyladenine glycosylase
MDRSVAVRPLGRRGPIHSLVVDLAPLDRSALEGDVLAVARALLGQLVVRRERRGALTVGRIVEVEAYGGEGLDQSAHSYRGPTPRCEVMFGPAGHAYVYATQGRCVCLNVCAAGDGSGKAVLLRALEPVEGVTRMRKRRLVRLASGPTRERLLAGNDHELAQGPGRLCLCLDVDRTLNGVDLTDGGGPLFLAEGEPASEVLWTPRVGLNPKSEAFGWMWRGLVPGNRAVSPPKGTRGGRPSPSPSLKALRAGRA